MFPAIKHKKRALSEAEAREILARAEHGVLATVGADGWPYAVPLNHVLVGNAIYAHCARKGQKLDNIAHEARVSYCAVAKATVSPEEFTCHYESAILYGRAALVSDEEETVQTLRALTERFSNPLPATFEAHFAEHMRVHGRGAAMIRIDIEHITGKAHRASQPAAMHPMEASTH